MRKARSRRSRHGRGNRGSVVRESPADQCGRARRRLCRSRSATSPQWNFDDATFDRTAAAFDVPDHVAIVVHNYRWRLGLAPGEPQYDALQAQLAEAPVVTVPTITLEGEANGAPHPQPETTLLHRRCGAPIAAT
jgi:hypothetical protein